jgi:ribonuclease HII
MLEFTRIPPAGDAQVLVPWYEIGIDEVGRGCLMGPVLAAAVVLPSPEEIDRKADIWAQIKDSKKVSEKKRGILSSFIRAECPAFGFGWKTEKEIDTLNILQATLKAMHGALDNCLRSLANDEHYGIGSAYVWIDGNAFKTYQAPSSADGGDTEWRLYPECLVNADNIRLAVAAASILAKDERDTYMKQLVQKHPHLEHYGIEKNKGYGTKAHLDGIRNHGYTEFHRRSFCVKSLGMDGWHK